MWLVIHWFLWKKFYAAVLHSKFYTIYWSLLLIATTETFWVSHKNPQMFFLDFSLMLGKVWVAPEIYVLSLSLENFVAI